MARNPVAIIEMEFGQDAVPGDSIRMLCPFCGGGQGQERSMSAGLSEDGAAILYHCWRNKCGVSGAIPRGGAGLNSVKYEPRKKEIIRADLEIVPEIPAEVRQQAYNAWHILQTHTELGQWGWCASMNRVAMPIRNQAHSRRGWVLRSLMDVKPKTLTALDVVGPRLSWFYRAVQAPTIVVEDMVSAVRGAVVKPLWNFVAINGTHLTPSEEQELASMEHVVFALDRDAVETSAQHCLQFKLLVPRAGFLILPKDLKNLTDKEIEECLASVT